MKSDPRLFEYYTSLFAEGERLSLREGQLELVRTKELLIRFLPNAPADIIDIGGGTGVYASWLASLGHNVHLIDIVPEHVEAAEKFDTFTAMEGDARTLSEPDDSYDIALLLGPLYHLQNNEERLLALSEAKRVVKPGGLVMAAFISRGAVALDGYVKGWVDNPGGVESMVTIMQGGMYDADRSGFGVISYFHLPSEAQAELVSAGLEVESIFGIEGPGWVAHNFDERWQTEEGKNVVLESARACESEPELQALSGHLLAVTRCP